MVASDAWNTGWEASFWLDYETLLSSCCSTILWLSLGSSNSLFLAEESICSLVALWTWWPCGGTLVPKVIWPTGGVAFGDFALILNLLRGVDMLSKDVGAGLLEPALVLAGGKGIRYCKRKLEKNNDKEFELKSLKSVTNIMKKER